MGKYLIAERTFDFAVNVVGAYRQVCSEKKEFVLSRQFLRAGTSIGANVAEAQRGQTKPDFVAKMCVALKEANETHYWLRLLHQTNYLGDAQFTVLMHDLDDILGILTAIVKTASQSMKAKSTAPAPHQ